MSQSRLFGQPTNDIVNAPENTVKDFVSGDVVLHVFFGRYATVEKVGRKYLSVRIHLTDQLVKWLPTSVVKRDG